MADRKHRLGPITKSEGKRSKDVAVLEVFLSHSGKDVEIAKRLITLIRSALNIPADSIRCTSVDGFRLPIGITIQDRLRREIEEAKVFVALLTPNSLNSSWVLFELGARWRTRKPLLPLLSGATPRELQAGPLSVFNSLSCGEEAQMFQFIDNLGHHLGRKSESAAVYRKCITEVVELSGTEGEASLPNSSLLNGMAMAHVSLLKGWIGHSVKWKSAWLELDSPRDFIRGERLLITLGGMTKTKERPAEKVLVRFVQAGDDPDDAVGIITPVGVAVRADRTVEVPVPSNYMNVVQISIHGGEFAWNHFLGEGNGPATLIRIELLAKANATSTQSR